MVHPIIDEYYNKNPAYTRSSQYAAEKGLTTNPTEKTCTTHRTSTPSPALTSKSSSSSETLSKHIPLPTSRLNECMSSSLPIRSKSPERAEHGYRQILSITALSARDPLKPQEQGNTKKKRVSLVALDPHVLDESDSEFQPLSLQPQRPSRATSASASTSPGSERTGYGSPAKINQYFPELS